MPLRPISRFAVKRSQIRPGSTAERPNHARVTRMRSSQLGGWACPAWPLRLFPPSEGGVLEPAVEVLLGMEHLVDDAREFEGDQGARDLARFLAGLRPVERADLGVLPHGAHRGVTEGELEVAVAHLRAGPMARAPGGVGRPGD